MSWVGGKKALRDQILSRFPLEYMELVSAALQELLQQKDAPIFHMVNKKQLEGLLQAEYLWPWYGQLMKVPQTIAFMLQINFWLEHYQVQLV